MKMYIIPERIKKVESKLKQKQGLLQQQCVRS